MNFYPYEIFLASKSPRRQELLKQIGIQFKVLEAEYDEAAFVRTVQYLPCEQQLQQLALYKAQTVASTLLPKNNQIPILAADTVVCIDNEVLGKPLNEAECIRMLMALSDRTHHVKTALALVVGEESHTCLSDNSVSFRKLQENEIRRYWQTGEPADKAGGYAIQGIGAGFVKHISGSYSGIVGLPLYETINLLDSFGKK